MKQLTFFLLLFFAASGIKAQTYTVTAKGNIRTAGCQSNITSLIWIRLNYTDGTTEYLFNRAERIGGEVEENGNYKFVKTEIDGSKKELASITFKTHYKERDEGPFGNRCINEEKPEKTIFAT